MPRRLDPGRKRPYVLLDAGGTLVYPNASLLTQAAKESSCEVDEGAFLSSFFRMVHQFDQSLRTDGSYDRTDTFLLDLVLTAGVASDVAKDVVDRVQVLCGAQSLWTYALPWTREALEALRSSGYSMSVVSNSNGTVAQQMADLSLSPYFDAVFDSHVLGVAKPDPRIFRLVLAELGLEPRECIYVGDVFMVDVLGANTAGIPAVHLDPLGLYEQWPGTRTKEVRAFADLLVAGGIDLRDGGLKPFPAASA